jgi:hypothetical protein
MTTIYVEHITHSDVWDESCTTITSPCPLDGGIITELADAFTDFLEGAGLAAERVFIFMLTKPTGTPDDPDPDVEISIVSDRPMPPPFVVDFTKPSHSIAEGIAQLADALKKGGTS